MPRTWTPEQRAEQAAKIANWHPWNKSTGPKTKAGKTVTARNAWKGGVRGQLRALGRLMRDQREMMERVTE